MGRWLNTILLSSLLLAALPTSTTYQLDSYGVGSGGGSGSSATYSIEGTTGETSGTVQTSTTYTLNSGMVGVQQANTPAAPTLANTGTWPNKLHLTIDNGGNPADSTFAVAISTDNFVTTNYVQSDMTVGAALGPEDYLTYSAWGSGTGVDIIGLTPSTTYKVKVKARHGDFTESGYSNTATDATAGPQLSFSVSTNSLTLSGLIPGSVITAGQTIDVTFATNASSGGSVYVNGLHAGLFSTSKSTTITSASVDLSVASSGFGAIVSAVGQTTGGPMAKVAPYNGASNNVGLVDTTIRPIMTTTAAISGGTGSVLLKAKSQISDKASPDYTETITLLASASF